MQVGHAAKSLLPGVSRTWQVAQRFEPPGEQRAQWGIERSGGSAREPQ